MFPFKFALQNKAITEQGKKLNLGFRLRSHTFFKLGYSNNQENNLVKFIN